MLLYNKKYLMKDIIYTRKKFIKVSTKSAAAAALYLNLPHMSFAKSNEKTRIVLIRNNNVLLHNNKINKIVLQQMLDKALCTLLEVNDPLKAWRQILKPSDILGIKTNVWNYLPTPPEIQTAIKNRALDIGIPKNNISIRDRGLLWDSIFMNATALINIRPLRTHHWSGVGSLIKNYITFVKKPYEYHSDSCADLAKIWELPQVKGKTRLNILVLLTPLFHGTGPHHFNPKYTWSYKGLLLGFDPVAVDTVGVRILMAKRRDFFKEDLPLNPPPKHIFLADTRHHLGIADISKINLIRLGWKNNLLI